MCGIVGYIGKRQAAPILLEGLKRLEYRGYDSAGIAVFHAGELFLMKRKGSVRALSRAKGAEGSLGIGHTRWATHGAPSARNAHPHVYRNIVLVHNGIIENAEDLRRECLARGERFASETDSEVIAHLIAHVYRGDLLCAVRESCSRLEGAYALAVMCKEEERIVCVRQKSPLVVAEEDGEQFVASDLPALAGKAERAYVLCDGEYVSLGKALTFYDSALNPIEKAPEKGQQAQDSAAKGRGHFMLREMAEIPAAMAKTAQNFEKEYQNSGLCEVLCHAEYIDIIACGTAYHAGLCAKYAIEAAVRIPVRVSVASEYRYMDPIVKRGTLAVAISQSGETADTLAAAQLAKAKGANLLAIVNVQSSSLSRIAEHVLMTYAGQEVAVAATKSFNAQLMALYLLTEKLARAKGRTLSLPPLAKAAKEALVRSEAVRAWAERFAAARDAIFIGRGADYCTALEGSLKLKEITYLPSEGYPAGELKHGTLALIGEDTPVVAVVTEEGTARKTMNAVHEVAARSGKVFLVTMFAELCKEKEVFASLLLPKTSGLFSPAVAVIPLQKLAYHTALARGNDPDKPRNLAKSVTVE